MDTKSNVGEILRIQISVSKDGSPALYEILNKAGKHYRAKRIMQLALAGLSIENGAQIKSGGSAAVAPPAPAQPARKKNDKTREKATGEPAHYHIQDAASSLAGGMLDNL